VSIVIGSFFLYSEIKDGRVTFLRLKLEAPRGECEDLRTGVYAGYAARMRQETSCGGLRVGSICVVLLTGSFGIALMAAHDRDDSVFDGISR